MAQHGPTREGAETAHESLEARIQTCAEKVAQIIEEAREKMTPEELKQADEAAKQIFAGAPASRQRSA